MSAYEEKSDKRTAELKLSDGQIKELEELTGTKMTSLFVETEPFEEPPLGTPVLGKIFADPRTKLVRRINARFR